MPKYAAVLAGLDAVLEPNGILSNDLVAVTLTSDAVRRGGLMSQFLREKKILTANTLERSEWAERRRIRTLLASFEKEPWHAEVKDFAGQLSTHKPKLALRTQRVYLRAAARLLQDSKVTAVTSLTSEHVEAFLRRSAGHRASLTAWLSFLKERLGHPIPCPRLKANAVRSVGRSKKELCQEAKRLLAGLDCETRLPMKVAYLAKLLSIAYGWPLEKVLQMQESDVRVDGQNVFLRFGADWVGVNRRILDWTRWLVLENRRHSADTFLFPGRLQGDCLSTAAVIYHIKNLEASFKASNSTSSDALKAIDR